MNRIIKHSVQFSALLALAGSSAYAALPVGYHFDITTSYTETAPTDHLAGPAGNPDTSYLTVLNSGTSTFTGNLSLSGTSPILGGVTVNLNPFTLAPGDHVSLSLTDESSNYGGFNPNGSDPQFGAQFTMNGTVTDGVDTEDVLLQVFDRDIHSGVFRDAAGTSSDSYVLQGGNPFGIDTGDAFEESQAPGHFAFIEQAGGSNNVPDAGSTLSLFGMALGFATVIRRKLS